MLDAAGAAATLVVAPVVDADVAAVLLGVFAAAARGLYVTAGNGASSLLGIAVAWRDASTEELIALAEVGWNDPSAADAAPGLYEADEEAAVVPNCRRPSCASLTSLFR